MYRPYLLLMLTWLPLELVKLVKPEVWSSRVAVRHYSVSRRQATIWNSQTSMANRQVDRGGQTVSRQGSGHRQYPVCPPQSRQDHQQVMGSVVPDPVKISNFYEILGQIGNQEISNHIQNGQ